ncbi:MAG: hypothetical protein GY822_22205 [Deltaproteobacteria bacterium]|nr:hypothetical protein [Deltaproteobacteria bacterium]
MNREWWAHAVLLLAATTLALLTANGTLTSSRNASEKTTFPPVADGETLEEVFYTFPGAKIVLDVKKQNEKWSAIVNYSKEIRVKPTSSPHDAGVLDAGQSESAVDAGKGADGNARPEKVELQTKRFPSSKTVNRSLKKMLPLNVVRSLGNVSDDKLEQMNLKKAERTLRLVVDGREISFNIGAAAYGGRHRYLQKQGDSKVLLVDNGAIRGLEGPHLRLMERRIFKFDWKNTLAVQVQLPKTEPIRFVLLEPAQSKKRRFVDPAQPDAVIDEAMSFARAIQRISAKTYVAKEEAKGDVVASFALELQGKKLRGELIQGQENRYFLRSGEWTLEISEGQGRDLLLEAQELSQRKLR